MTTKDLYHFFQKHPAISQSTFLSEADAPRALIQRVKANKDNDLPLFVYGNEEENKEATERIKKLCEKYG